MLENQREASFLVIRTDLSENHTVRSHKWERSEGRKSPAKNTEPAMQIKSLDSASDRAAVHASPLSEYEDDDLAGAELCSTRPSFSGSTQRGLLPYFVK